MSKGRRLMGQTSGATQNEDGSIDIAPMWAEELRSIQRREIAVRQLEIEALKFARDNLVDIHRDAERIWNRLKIDLALNFDDFEFSVAHRPDGSARLLVRPRLREDATAMPPIEAATGAEVSED